MAYVPPLNGGRINATIAGNTAGVGTLVSTGTLALAGGNNITLSQNGNTVSIAAPTQTNQTLSFSAGSQSTLTATGTFDARSMFINGVGAVKVGFSQSSVFISAPTQTVETQSIGMLGGGAGSTAGTSGNATGGQLAYNFYAGTNITLSQSLNGASASLTIQGGAGGAGGGIALSDGAHGITSGTANIQASGALTASITNQSLKLSAPNVSSLYGAGGVTLSSNGNSISISAPTQTNQTLSFSAGSQSTLTATGTFDARSMFINGVGNISAGFSQSSIFVSGSQSVQTQSNVQGIIASGSTNRTGDISFANSNGVTFGLSNNTITASVAAGTGGGGAFSAGVSGGNTVGNAGLAGNQVVFSGGNNITLSQVTGAGGSNTIGISGPTISSLTGAGVITVTSAGSTVSVSAPGPISQYIHNSAGLLNGVSQIQAITLGSLSVVRMLIPQHLSFTRVDMPVSVTVGSTAAANTAAMAVSSVGVIYSRSGSTLNPIIGQSSSTTFSYNSNNTGSVTGARMVSFGLATSLTAGEYYFGVQLSTANSSVGTATTAGGWSMSVVVGSAQQNNPWTDLGVGTASSVNALYPLHGMVNSSLSVTNQTIQQSQISQYSQSAIRANLIVGFNG
jgi:hypothetical protein